MPKMLLVRFFPDTVYIYLYLFCQIRQHIKTQLQFLEDGTYTPNFHLETNLKKHTECANFYQSAILNVV